MDNEQNLLTNELLLALLNQLYSIELMLADVYNGKANMRYSNEILDRDRQVLAGLMELVKSNLKETFDEK